MEAFFHSALLVFISEMGDKTQLLALVLAARYRKPWIVMAGIFVATVLNHGLASWAGEGISKLVRPETLVWILSATFFIFAIWVLVPDKEEELNASNRFGAFLTTVIVFFLAEMGDKTQLVTVALGAQYDSISIVTAGTTLGMMGSNALAVAYGEKFLKRVPMKLVRRAASLIFVLFGLMILVGYAE